MVDARGGVEAPAPLLPGSSRARLLWLLGLGGVLRLALIALTAGHNDVTAMADVVASFVDGTPFDAYAENPGGAGFQPFPYPPGALPVLGALMEAAGPSLQTFRDLVRIAVGAADLALATIVFVVLRRRFDDRIGLAGAGLLALGPVPLLISGYMGQIESVALLPAVAGLLYLGVDRRDRTSVIGGALLGLGTSVKTYPGLLAPAVLAHLDRRDVRRVVLAGLAALVVVVALLVPFVLEDESSLDTMVGYGGAPGLGGISLLLDPATPGDWYVGGVERNPVSGREAMLQRFLLVVGVGTTALVALRRGLDRPAMIGALLLAQSVWGYTWFPQYGWWPVLGLVLIGRHRACAVLQALLLVPTIIAYRWESFGAAGLSEAMIDWLYVPFSVAAFGVMSWCWVRVLTRSGAPATDDAADASRAAEPVRAA